MRKNLLLIPFLFFSSFLLAQSQASDGVRHSNQSIKIYPNPAFNFIGLNESAGISSIIIYNLVGRKMKIFASPQKGEKYNVTDLPSGMYLVQLLGRDGKVVTTQRMSKK